jgi:hypothetical protein
MDSFGRKIVLIKEINADGFCKRSIQMVRFFKSGILFSINAIWIVAKRLTITCVSLVGS